MGLGLLLTESEAPAFRIDPSFVVFDHQYSGTLPMSGKDPFFMSWVNREKDAHPAKYDGGYSVLLQFSSESINIGDISTGRVKNIIDCLYPVTGDDRRIEFLQVEKGLSSIEIGGIRIVIAKI